MNNIPIRVQRKRTKGWRMPENTVYVGRPTCYGNPFVVGDKGMTAEDCVNLYEVIAKKYSSTIKKDLQGKNLACWCQLDKPCHADVLLEIANK